MFLLRKAALMIAALPFLVTTPANAITMKECSAKYRDAKEAGTLNGMKWNDFRKAQCGDDSDDDAPALDEAKADSDPVTPTTKAPRGVSFPKAVNAKFKDETPARQRMKTCLESYYENKDAGKLDGLRWIQKGGGYYSLCNARLKGE